ncbi:MAG: complex I subunit 1 family protein [Candidatus Bathyarchaeia archaeon]
MEIDPLQTIIQMMVFPGIAFVMALSLFLQWLNRKLYARLQNRYGPLHTGFAGILQPLADFIKLLAKEDIEMRAVYKAPFRILPILLLTIPLTATMYIPMADPFSGIVGFEGDLVFVLFLLTLYAILVFLAAWSSGNPYSILGGVRTAVQLLGYEIPLAIVLLAPGIKAKTLSIRGIVEWQGLNLPFIIIQPLGFVVAIVGFMAELEIVPFDIPEAKTELIAGWQTEFSGRKLALIRLSRDVELALASSLIVALFLGGPSGPLPFPPIGWFLAKIVAIVFIISNLRALFARFRIDQMIRGSWKLLLPIALLQVALLLLIP